MATAATNTAATVYFNYYWNKHMGWLRSEPDAGRVATMLEGMQSPTPKCDHIIS